MLLSQRRLRRLGHLCRIEDGRLSKDILYGELAICSRPRGRPRLRFKDTCKGDLKSAGISVQTCERTAKQRSSWKAAVSTGTKEAELSRVANLRRKRAARKSSQTTSQKPSVYICGKCQRDCHSRIGLHSHSKKCADSPWCSPSSYETGGGRRR